MKENCGAPNTQEEYFKSYFCAVFPRGLCIKLNVSLNIKIELNLKTKTQFRRFSEALFWFMAICSLCLVVFVSQKCMDELHSKVQRITSKAVEEDKAAVQQLKETLKSFKAKANML